MGLGGVAKIRLSEAGEKAAAQRLLVVDKIDPLERREAENSAKKVEAARSMIFAQCAKAYIDSHTAGWRKAKQSKAKQSKAKQSKAKQSKACSAMDEYPRNVRLS